MFTNKAADGANNICGKNVALLRKKAGKRFVTDIELTYLAKVLHVSIAALTE